MQVTTSTSDIKKAMRFCAKVAKNSQGHYGEAVLVRTVADGIRFLFDGGDLQATGTFEAFVEQHGEVAVDVKDFAKYLAALDEDEVRLISDGETLFVENDSSDARLPMLLLPETPRPREDVPGAQRVSPDLPDWIDLVSFACAPSVNSGALYGVHVHPGGLVATDGYKLAMLEFDWPEIEPVTIPASYVEAFPDPADYGDGEVYMAHADGRLQFKFGNYSLFGPTIIFDYPSIAQIRSVMPPEEGPTLSTPLKEFQQALKQIAAIIPNSDLATITLNPDGVVHSEHESAGVADYTMDDTESTLEVPVAFTLRHARVLLRLAKGEERIFFHFASDKTQERLFTIERDNMVIGIMPVRKQ